MIETVKNSSEEDLSYLLPELDVSEVETILKTRPETARIFLQKIAKKELDWESLTPTERGILIHGGIESQIKTEEELSAISALKKADWLREPPTPYEFLNDPKYLGEFNIYKPWKEDLMYVLDPKNQIFEHICSGGLGVGKSVCAVIAQLYKLSVLTCLKNIPTYFGLSPSTTISFGLFSLSIGKAEDSIANDFKNLISGSPYFKNIFPIKKSRTVKRVMNNQSGGQIATENYEIILPQGLNVLVGSRVNHALSLAVVSAVLDEMNFRTKRTVKYDDDEDSSEKLYNQVRFRLTSRFERLGYTPGILSVISSKRTSSDFLESHIAKVNGGLTQKSGGWVAKEDPHVFISSYSQWDVKPEKYYEEGKPKKSFHVFIGSSKNSSRILTDEELLEYPENSPSIIEVPESVKRHFQTDINAALRELAGISSSPQNLLFEDPTKIKTMWDDRKNPFMDEEIYVGLRTNRSIASYLLRDRFFEDVGFAVIPKYHPSMLRTIHVDLSKSGDATGIVMGGISALKEYVGQNSVGNNLIKSYSPEIFIDFALSIKAPQGDQIDYEKIQQFISYLRYCKFNIHLVTFDTYNSTSSMQMLIKDGFNVGNVSVDRTDTAYKFLRDAVYNGHVRCYKHKILEKELANLIHDYSGGGRSKVDHPRMNPDGSKGRKDCADGVAGCTFNCYQMLTDVKKYPFTANTDIAAKIIDKLFAEREQKDTFPILAEEGQSLNNYVDFVNPFTLK